MKLSLYIFKIAILPIVIALLTFFFPAFLTAQEHPNTITFDNQAGEYALVKLVGPTLTSIEVPNGEKRTVHAAKGEYYILTRYGKDPKKYKFSKGETFEVTQSKTEYSKTTITLYPVIDGNYSTTPISKEDFDNTITINWKNIHDRKEKVDINDVVIAAKNGDDIAQFYLGYFFAEGAPEMGIEKNYIKAEYWWCKSAYKRNLKAYLFLMKLHESKSNYEKLKIDNVNVINKIIENAVNNNPISQYRLGVRFEKGVNFKKDIKEAFYWYKLSALNNFAPSQYQIGLMYAHNIGVKRNCQEAAKWFRKAADQGYPEAQYNLAVLYSKGVGVPHDDKEAERWFEKTKNQVLKRDQD